METPRDCPRTADPRPFSEGMRKRYGHTIILSLHTALNHQAKLSKKLSRTPSAPCLVQRHAEPVKPPSHQKHINQARESIQAPPSPLVRPLIFSLYTPNRDDFSRPDSMKLMHSSAAAIRSLLHVSQASIAKHSETIVQVVHDCRQKEHGSGPATRTAPYPACVYKPVIGRPRPTDSMPAHPQPAA